MNRFLVPSALAFVLFVPAGEAVAQRPAAKAGREGYNLAFVEADVRRVVDAVLGTMLGADYSVDADVQGNITLRTSKPVAREELVPLLERALSDVGVVIIQRNNSYRIMARDQARAQAPIAEPPSTTNMTSPAPAASGGYASEVVALRRASAREIARILEQFLGKDIIGSVDEARNQVVILGNAEERMAARKLIERFDVDTLANMQFDVVKLENVDADTIANELHRVFQPPYDIIGSRVRLIPLPRLRSLLLIASAREDIDRVMPWIHRLDTGIAGKRKLYNYIVQNGRARDLADSLQQVLATGAGYGGNGQIGTAMPAAGPVPSPASSPVTQSPAPASLAAAATSDLTSPMTAASGPRIVPNDANNSLIIYADGEEYDLIRQALEQLDQPVPQVLLEATLAEVTLSDDFRFGVNFNWLSGDTRVVQSNAATSVPTSVFPGFSVSVLRTDVAGVLNTLQSKTNVRVLSAPKLIVLNNQSATLQVGDQVPIVVQQSQSVTAPGAPVINTVEMRDTGVILKVTPRVNDSGTITIDISQEVSDVAETTSSGINSPTIQQRRLSSTIATRNGQMVALGGLIRDRSTLGKSGIPLLSQIPVVGGLFGNRTQTRQRTELIILLTPTIIRSPEQVRSVVDTLVDKLDATLPLVTRARAQQVGGNGPQQP